MAQYKIRRMQPNEVQIAIDWAEKEGWNPGLHDAACFYQADPNGFFMGVIDDKPVSVGCAVVYDSTFAFCGLYIVKKECRGQGYGLKLTEERLKYVGNRVTGIDGVVENVKIYEKIGYVPSHKQVRYEWKERPSFSPSPSIADLKNIPFDDLQTYDRKYFPAPRPAFLRCWIQHGQAVGHVEHKQLKGYGVIRKCCKGYKIGPLFAESPSIAESLLKALAAKVDQEEIYLDIPEPNENAQALVKQYGMTPKFEVIRMYRNGFPDINLSDNIYGNTTFEIG